MIGLLKKIKALAQQGIDGEKTAAQAKLRSLMSKYGLTEADLTAAETSEFAFDVPTHLEFLFVQTIYMATGDHQTPTNKDGAKYKVTCTPAQAAEIDLFFGAYSEHYAKEVELFNRAFVYKNELFPATEVENENEAETPINSRVEQLIGLIRRGRTPRKKLT